MHTVVELEGFISGAKVAGLSDEERRTIVDAIAAAPVSGKLIVGTGGARKVRFAGHGKGKSGGFRVITYFAGEDVPVFLLNVFSKGQRVDLTQQQRNELRAVLGRLADLYREGMKLRVQGR